jgi:ribonuclease P protein component
MYNLDTLPKRIKSKGEIEKIYTLGKPIISTDKKVKAIYLLTPHENLAEIKYAITLSSKTGNSVWRNKFKRLIRESVTAEADLLREIILLGKSDLSIIFSSGSITQINHRQIFLNDIKPAVFEILFKLKKPLEKEKKAFTTAKTDLQIDTR